MQPKPYFNLENNLINIGVTGTGSLIGQGIIKCIKQSRLKDRVKLTGFDYISDSVGSYWCDDNYLLPDIFKRNEKEEDWIKKVAEYIKLHQLRLLFIGIDFELPVFARLKPSIEEQTGCFIIVSSPGVIEIANDKYLTAEFLKKNGLAYPLSFTTENFKSGDLAFPLIIKPRVGARSVGFNLIKNQEQFEKAIETVKDPVIQECIGSMETEYTCGVIFLDQKMKASIALSRTLKEGNTFTANYNKNAPKEIYDYIEKVSLALKPFGVVNFQLRLDGQGVPKIFEINPRHSGTTYMRTLFGYNEVEYIICYLLNEELPDMKNLSEGKAVRFYDEFLVKPK
jgi:carbamoyl-phosphate synthase large subunit